MLNKLKGEVFVNKYICLSCEYNYDSEIGDPVGGIAPGTNFEDIPAEWVCPVCGIHMIEITIKSIFKVII
jgi:rubredoxin